MKWIGPSRLAGMAAPLVVWAVHFVLVYSITGLACADAWAARQWLGVRLFVWALLAWTAVALALIAWFARRAQHARRRHARAIEAADAATRRELERQCFAARATMLIAAIAAIAVAFTAVPVFVVPDCT